MNQPPKIVLVDDDPNFLEIFSVALGGAGLDVVTAKSGEEGVSKVKETKPDLVLCDMNMPGMSGADTVKAIKESGDVKTVFLTNLGGAGDLSMENNISLAKDLGAVGYIMKSDEMSVIVEKVKSFLN